MTKPTKWHVHPVKTQISLGICLVWSGSLLCTQWVAKDPSFLYADSKDWSDWVNAQADLNLCWVYMPFCSLCQLAILENGPYHMLSTKAQIGLHIWPVWSGSSLFSYRFNGHFRIWASEWPNLQWNLCDQQRLRSVCTSIQYGKSSYLSLFGWPGGCRHMWAKTDQTGQMCSLIRVFAGCTNLIVGFVVHWLLYQRTEKALTRLHYSPMGHCTNVLRTLFSSCKYNNNNSTVFL